LQEVEKMGKWERLLADNGTILWYGDLLKYLFINNFMFFNLLNNIVWENTNDHKNKLDLILN
jgi:hypothetical protein